MKELPKQITVEERQAIEILYLKITNLDLQRKTLINDIQKAEKMIGEFQEELKKKADEIQAKYGIVLGKDQINPDGTIVPTAQA